MDKKQNVIIGIVKKFLNKLNFDIENVILCGSYARGNFREDSDVDLIIVSNEFSDKKMYKRGKELYNKWFDDYDYDVDFVCLTPDEFNKQKNQISVIKEALNDGIVIK